MSGVPGFILYITRSFTSCTLQNAPSRLQVKLTDNLRVIVWKIWYHHLGFQKWCCAIRMTSQIMRKLNQLRENINFLTLRQSISISFEDIVNEKKKYQKMSKFD